MNLFEVNLASLNQKLIEESDNLIKSILSHISDSNQSRATDCCKKFDTMIQKLDKRADDAYVLVEIDNYIDQCRNADIKQLKEEFIDC